MVIPNSLNDRGARAVSTPYTREIETALRFVADNCEVSALVGDPGLGKAFGAELSARHLGLPLTALTVGPKPTPKELVVRLLRILRGGTVTGALYDLTDELVEVLATSRRVVVVDEAQNLTSDGLNQLRFLHDAPDANWGLLLVGGHRCEASLCREPQLESRVSRWVRLKPLTGDPLLTSLRAYHPIFQFAEDKLLFAIDDQIAKGNWRRWARFLQAALDVAERTGHDVLDKNLARATVAELGPRPKKHT